MIGSVTKIIPLLNKFNFNDNIIQNNISAYPCYRTLFLRPRIWKIDRTHKMKWTTGRSVYSLGRRSIKIGRDGWLERDGAAGPACPSLKTRE